MRAFVQYLLQFPLRWKLVGANALLLSAGLIVLLLSPQEAPERVAALALLFIAAAVNVVLVYLALVPLATIQSVAEAVTRGDYDRRVPPMILADRDADQSRRVFNGLLDHLAADTARAPAGGRGHARAGSRTARARARTARRGRATALRPLARAWCDRPRARRAAGRCPCEGCPRARHGGNGGCAPPRRNTRARSVDGAGHSARARDPRAPHGVRSAWAAGGHRRRPHTRPTSRNDRTDALSRGRARGAQRPVARRDETSIGRAAPSRCRVRTRRRG